jgi:cell division protein FtsQ
MDAKAVYDIALGQVDRSMLNVDLEAVRADIARLPWVQDARVSRRLPDTLIVDIVERKPTAVWQHQGNLALIDANGVVLEAVSADAMPNLPLLVGDAANMQATRLSRLMEAAPALKSLLTGATWVGNRRWDLRFQSGETLALPEGDAPAAAALVNFARLDGVNHLLGRGVLRFDMRDPTKMVMRMPEGRTVPAAAVPTNAINATGATQGEAAEAKKPEAALPQALASREQG